MPAIQKPLAFRADDLAELERERATVYWSAYNDELGRQLATAQLRFMANVQLSPLLAGIYETIFRADETLRRAVLTANRSR